MKEDHLLETIFQTSHLFVMLLDEEGKLIEANQEVLEFIDCKMEDVREKKFWKTPWWSHSDNLQKKLKEEIKKASREEEIRFEARHFSPEGKSAIVDFIIRSIESKDGSDRLLALGRDITDRIQSEKKHKIITEASSQAIYLFQDGKFKFVNESFENLTGYSQEELNGMDFLKLIHPDYKNRIAKWTQQALTGDDTGLPERVEYKIVTKKGGEIWARSLPSIIEFEGKPAIVGNAVDITQEMEMKQKLKSERELLESIMTLTPDLIYFKDDKHRYERVNKAYEELLDLDESEMIGETAKSFWPEWEKILEDECQVLSGEPVIGRERKATLPNGECRWYSINKLPRRDAEGNITGILGMDRDITQQKKIEKKLNEREREMSILLSNLPGMAYRCKNIRNWSMQFVSEGCKDLTGYLPEELAGDQGVSYGDLIIEEDTERVWKSIQEQINSRSSYQLEYRIRTKTGKRKWVWEQGRGVYDSNGNLQNLQGFITNITERKQTEQALDEERNKLKNLHEAVDLLQQKDTEEAMLQTAVEVVEKMLDLELCAISILEGKYLVPRANSEDLGSDETVKFKVGEGIAGKTIDQGETIWGDDVRNFPEAKPTNEEFRGFISVPLGDLGNLQIISKEKGSFTERDVELVEILAGHLQEELKRIRLEEDLRQQAIRDPLTDLYNRRYFNETLEKEVQKVKRYDGLLSFLMFDIDSFKKVNDRYSHQTGDKVLQELANLLKDNVRSADTVVRYGGDEFLVMMPETEEEVKEVVSRLKQSLDQWNDQNNLIDFRLSLSMGVSHWRPNQDRDVEETLKEADRRMYEDKEM